MRTDHSDDPHALSEQLEHEAGELEDRSHETEHEIDAARTDWERKRADPSVPGARRTARRPALSPTTGTGSMSSTLPSPPTISRQPVDRRGVTMPEEAEIRELREVQELRVKRETEQARRARDAEERVTHERRADKAAYLRDKLAEQAGTPDE